MAQKLQKWSHWITARGIDCSSRSSCWKRKRREEGGGKSWWSNTKQTTSLLDVVVRTTAPRIHHLSLLRSPQPAPSSRLFVFLCDYEVDPVCTHNRISAFLNSVDISVFLTFLCYYFAGPNHLSLVILAAVRAVLCFKFRILQTDSKSIFVITYFRQNNHLFLITLEP
jgi:hypothetical protein